MATWKPPSFKQPAKGYRFSVDAFLLASFAARFRPGLFLDVGTGSGPIAAQMLRFLPHSRCLAVERQADLASFAAINLCKSRSTLVVGDVRHLPLRAKCLDLAVCNPPFFEQGRGKLASHSQRMAARHALHGNLVDFANSVYPSLKHGGLFCYVYPMLDFQRMFQSLSGHGWYHHQILEIASFEDEPPKLVCAAIGRHESIEPCKQSLTLYKGHRDYSDQAHTFLTELHDF